MSHSQSLTTCKCKMFLGSVAEMKGSEARVVFYLHPKLSEGQVAKTKPQRFPSVRSMLLILGAILALGAIAFVLYKLTNKQFMDTLESLITTVGVIASSSLLLVCIAIVFANRIDLIGRVAKAWRAMQGKPPRYKRPLLHSLPYYLAITRSCCEVSPFQIFNTARCSSGTSLPSRVQSLCPFIALGGATLLHLPVQEFFKVVKNNNRFISSIFLSDTASPQHPKRQEN